MSAGTLTFWTFAGAPGTAPLTGIVVPSRQTIRQAAKVRRGAYRSARRHYNALRRCARLLRRDMILAAGTVVELASEEEEASS